MTKIPIPTISKGEDEETFISRCMGDSTMNKEYPDNKQRSAVCYAQLRKGKESFGEKCESCYFFLTEFEPPEAGDASPKQKDILKKVYDKCRSDWVSAHPKDTENADNKTSCSKIAWHAAKQAESKKLDDRGRIIVAENVPIIFNGYIEEKR